ncbi:hypothetical protein WMW72_30325 [Paenibacillus filicis]|uniref:Uncharacterized protein n=1 Tax=Paenibacillus filicis TaxID=669464 RepID=A0ABU9DTI8_9BACL
MENVQSMMHGPNMHMPNVSPAVSPAMTQPMPAAPINVHASYEEINIYAPKKHHHHHHHMHHMPVAVSPVHTGPRMNVASILVLYILLVIILRSFPRC